MPLIRLEFADYADARTAFFAVAGSMLDVKRINRGHGVEEIETGSGDIIRFRVPASQQRRRSESAPGCNCNCGRAG